MASTLTPSTTVAAAGLEVIVCIELSAAALLDRSAGAFTWAVTDRLAAEMNTKISSSSTPSSSARRLMKASSSKSSTVPAMMSANEITSTGIAPGMPGNGGGGDRRSEGEGDGRSNGGGGFGGGSQGGGGQRLGPIGAAQPGCGALARPLRPLETVQACSAAAGCGGWVGSSCCSGLGRSAGVAAVICLRPPRKGRVASWARRTASGGSWWAWSSTSRPAGAYR